MSLIADLTPTEIREVSWCRRVIFGRACCPTIDGDVGTISSILVEQAEKLHLIQWQSKRSVWVEANKGFERGQAGLCPGPWP
mmetsp:Transcript_39597/g.58799  ORF Transcript_39597/g.58799 Transcript_39597/m.58799 type:complete len:82 (+) Transcript_39597:278-523(+)